MLAADLSIDLSVSEEQSQLILYCVLRDAYCEKRI